MQKTNPVCWFDIHVADLERARQFYQAVFNVTLVDLPPAFGKQAIFPAVQGGPNAAGALVERPGASSDGIGTIVYFASEDCITEEARVVDAGGQIVQAKMSIGEFGFVSLFRDTEGNTIGLYSRQ